MQQLLKPDAAENASFSVEVLQRKPGWVPALLDKCEIETPITRPKECDAMCRVAEALT